MRPPGPLPLAISRFVGKLRRNLTPATPPAGELRRRLPAIRSRLQTRIAYRGALRRSKKLQSIEEIERAAATRRWFRHRDVRPAKPFVERSPAASSAAVPKLGSRLVLDQ